MTESWGIQPGDIVTRGEISKRYGGSINPGIVTSPRSNEIMTFSNPNVAAKYGYGLDGWSTDGTFFRYTGQGSYGDQVLKWGNRALNEQPESGKRIRLFVAVGKVPNSDKTTHEYLGEFTLDPDQPYVKQTQPDIDGRMRMTYVFNLFPMGPAVTDVGHVEGGMLPPSLAAVEYVDLEDSNVSNFERPALEPVVAEKREEDLVGRFRIYLEAMGHECGRMRIYAPGAKRPMFTDIVDRTANVLYEAKASAARGQIREALGQVLDYRRFLEVHRTRVLLPERPTDDLLDLLWGLDIGAAWPDGDTFAILDEPACV